MNEPMLGLLIEGEAKRDAIHVALAPVTSDEILNPGQRVSLVEGSSDKVKASNANTVGIVDPFLKGTVQPGQRFWLCLYCKTVTSLRHQWTHPAFPEEVIVGSDSSVQWIRRYAADLGFSYDEIMDGAREHLASGDHMSTGDNDVGTDPEFWTHFEIVTGRKVEGRPSFFSCSC